MNKLYQFAALSTALIMVGCSQNPSGIENKTGFHYAKDGVTRNIIVQPGHTLLQIAVEYGVAFKDLARINKLTPPYLIIAGQELKLPNEAYHIVNRGETTNSIALKYNVSTEDIINVNNLKAPYNIIIGQRLRVPNTTQGIHDEYESVPQQILQDEPNLNFEQSSITEINYTIDSNNSETLPDTPIISQDTYEDDFNSLEAQLSTDDRPIKENNRSLQGGFKKLYPLDSSEYEWPVNGKVTAHYGQLDNKFKEGIVIAAPIDTPISSIANGEVIYVGSDIPDYGKMVIIKHDNDILSAYAHNNSVLVKKGQLVTKGQSIAKVGKSGNVETPQLYFSVRKGKTTINPELTL